MRLLNINSSQFSTKYLDPNHYQRKIYTYCQQAVVSLLTFQTPSLF